VLLIAPEFAGVSQGCLTTLATLHLVHEVVLRAVIVFRVILHCLRLFHLTKPYAAASVRHSVDHLINHASYVDQATHATTDWSKSFRILWRSSS